jgi:hypothetical protein
MHSFFTAATAVVAASSLAFASPTPLRARGPAPEGNGSIDVKLDGKIYPPPILEGDLPQNVEIVCKNCWIKGDMAVSAGGDNIGSSLDPSENFTSPLVQAAGFDFSHTWVGFSMQSFAAHFEFEMTVTPVAANDTGSNDLVAHLLGVPLSIPVPLISGLALTIDPQLHGTINASRQVTFTHGFDMTVPAGSTLLIPVFHVDQSIAVGFNQTVTKTTDFQSSTDDLTLDFELSLRPTIGISISVLGESYTFGTYADLPKVGVKVEQIENASGDCSTTTANNAGGSAPLPVTYPKLTKVTPTIGLELGLFYNDEEFAPVDFSVPLKQNIEPTCLQFDPVTSLLVTPGSTDNKTDSRNNGDTPGDAATTGPKTGYGMMLAVVAAAFMLSV